MEGNVVTSYVVQSWCLVTEQNHVNVKPRLEATAT